MPSPQALVTFLTCLFVLLLATRLQLDLSPVASAALSLALALALAWIVDRRVPVDRAAEAEEDITQEAETEIVRPE